MGDFFQSVIINEESWRFVKIIPFSSLAYIVFGIGTIFSVKGVYLRPSPTPVADSELIYTIVDGNLSAACSAPVEFRRLS